MDIRDGMTYDDCPEPDDNIVGWSDNAERICPWCLAERSENNSEVAEQAGQIRTGECDIGERCEACDRLLEWRRLSTPGCKVWWTDPDDNIGSGWWNVIGLRSDFVMLSRPDSIGNETVSIAHVPYEEISWEKPE